MYFHLNRGEKFTYQAGLAVCWSKYALQIKKISILYYSTTNSQLWKWTHLTCRHPGRHRRAHLSGMPIFQWGQHWHRGPVCGNSEMKTQRMWIHRLLKLQQLCSTHVNHWRLTGGRWSLFQESRAQRQANSPAFSESPREGFHSASSIWLLPYWRGAADRRSWTKLVNYRNISGITNQSFGVL